MIWVGEQHFFRKVVSETVRVLWMGTAARVALPAVTQLGEHVRGGKFVSDHAAEACIRSCCSRQLAMFTNYNYDGSGGTKGLNFPLLSSRH